MTNYSEIQCPQCGGKIIIDAKLLIQGGSFSCTSKDCDASVALGASSHDVADSAMREFERLKQEQL